jgi:hypothetical protein
MRVAPTATWCVGPDLSRVGAARSATYLIDSIRNPDKELSSGMTDPNNHYGLPYSERGFIKSELHSVELEKSSLGADPQVAVSGFGRAR